jgi:hypothetical protein
MVTKRVLFVLMIVVLVLPALAVTPLAGAQQEAAGMARVRIGYFAFDPYQIDTLIDDEPMASGGWEEGAWLSSSFAAFGMPAIILGPASTPYLNFPSAVHNIAFVPKGEGLEAAIFGPQEVTFEDGHYYSLAVVGEMEDNSLNVLVIDETEAFSEADPSTDYMITLVNDIKGVPPITFTATSRVVAENLGYGQFATGRLSGDYQPRYFRGVTTGDQSAYLFAFTTSALPPGLLEFSVLIGSYPGIWGKDYFWVGNWWYVGDITVSDGGTVAVGDTIAGEIPKVGNRVDYTLTLDSDASLNLYASATGPRTDDESGTTFDPILYVYDAQGRTLYWNDESTYKDDILGDTTIGISDAGLEGIELTAGVYIIEVGGWMDIASGPYKLTVESAAND